MDSKIEIDSLQSPEELQGAARSGLYRFLAESFRFPSEALHKAIQKGEFIRTLEEICSGLPYQLPPSAGYSLTDALARIEASYEDFEADYIRLFDVGAAGTPPCPIYGGEYKGGSRMKVMEDLVRCYEYFGLVPAPQRQELPDHITVELEFMHYLAFKETYALHAKLDSSAYQRAERDFLERHLAAWLPLLRAKLAGEESLPFFKALVAFADEAARADLGYLRERTAGAFWGTPG